MTACLTREKIDAALWTNNYPIPKKYCDEHPDLHLYGHKRKVVVNGVEKWELISICQEEARAFVEMHEDDFNALVDEALPKPNEQNPQ